MMNGMRAMEDVFLNRGGGIQITLESSEYEDEILITVREGDKVLADGVCDWEADDDLDDIVQMVMQEAQD